MHPRCSLHGFPSASHMFRGLSSRLLCRSFPPRRADSQLGQREIAAGEPISPTRSINRRSVRERVYRKSDRPEPR